MFIRPVAAAGDAGVDEVIRQHGIKAQLEGKVGPGEHFIFKEIKWPAAPPFRRKLDFTVFYDCTGSCSGGGGSQKTFSLIVP